MSKNPAVVLAGRFSGSFVLDGDEEVPPATLTPATDTDSNVGTVTINNPPPPTQSTEEKKESKPEEEPKKKGAPPWLLWGLLGLAAAAAIWYGVELYQSAATAVTAPPPAPTVLTAPASTEWSKGGSQPSEY